ncbi:Nucleotidylyl transferase [Ramicandelaber brevisporus]|nr:Nucleotidylyl transferase [Ramicandelaber brevisporus]
MPTGTDYQFCTAKLSTALKDESRTPVVLVACGSFSPLTYLHLRIFEMARDYFNDPIRTEYELIGGYFSPVSDGYGKEGLAPAIHRVNMCKLATETSDWVMVDDWEALQPTYQRTISALDHLNEMLNIETGGGILLSNGERKPIKILMLAGGDLIESFGVPGLWATDDLHRILGDYGVMIVERTGTDVYGFLLSNDILYQHRPNVHIVKQLIYNDISSTKVRLFIKRGMSLKYLLPDSVIEYIAKHNLYRQ